VQDNVAMATRMAAGVAGSWWTSARGQVAANDDAGAMLDRLRIGHLAGRTVRSLGYGEQRQLEIAMALATRPSVLLLDEPTAGLSNAETAALTELVGALPDDLTVLIIEHDLGVIFELTDQLTVLQNGVMIASGPSAQIREDPIVKEVYLGR
jgi:branched-chain amino acid transport system ATP-binding protein